MKTTICKSIAPTTELTQYNITTKHVILSYIITRNMMQFNSMVALMFTRTYTIHISKLKQKLDALMYMYVRL